VPQRNPVERRNRKIGGIREEKGAERRGRARDRKT
jgi:hypothetical protein